MERSRKSNRLAEKSQPENSNQPSQSANKRKGKNNGKSAKKVQEADQPTAELTPLAPKDQHKLALDSKNSSRPETVCHGLEPHSTMQENDDLEEDELTQIGMDQKLAIAEKDFESLTMHDELTQHHSTRSEEELQSLNAFQEQVTQTYPNIHTLQETLSRPRGSTPKPKVDDIADYNEALSSQKVFAIPLEVYQEGFTGSGSGLEIITLVPPTPEGKDPTQTPSTGTKFVRVSPGPAKLVTKGTSQADLERLLTPSNATATTAKKPCELMQNGPGTNRVTSVASPHTSGMGQRDPVTLGAQTTRGGGENLHNCVWGEAPRDSPKHNEHRDV